MQRRDRADAGAISAALAERMPSLVVDLLGPPVRKYGADWRWGSNEALSVAVAGPDRGLWCDHADGSRGGDALDLVRKVRGGSLADALRWARQWLGQAGASRIPPAARKPPRAAPGPAAPDPEREMRTALALRIWREAGPARGTLAEAYLASRGLELPEDAPLRFHPACHRGAEPHPTMLALMSDPDTGEPCGVHRTFLAPDGSGKAPGQAKMMLGRAGVVRLVPDEDVTLALGIAEGIETCLRVMQRYRPGSVWAAASAGGIERFPILPGIEALTVWADTDDAGAGMAAARVCAARWSAAGREAAIKVPPGRSDFAALAGRAA